MPELTEAEECRVVALDLAVRASKKDWYAEVIVRRAAVFEKYLRDGTVPQ